MAAAIIVAFIGGSLVGAVMGVLVMSLGVMAKRNVDSMPEVPLAGEPAGQPVLRNVGV